MDERQKLIEELKCKSYALTFYAQEDEIGRLVDFILQDRKRVVEPLVKLPKRSIDYWDSMHKLAVMQARAIRETLSNAGVAK